MTEHLNESVRKIRTNRLYWNYVCILLMFSGCTQADDTHRVHDDQLESIRVQELDEPDPLKFKFKISGLPESDSIHVRTTFSPDQCDSSGHELHINGVAGTAATEITASLDNFSFKQHQVAYLCIKLDSSHPYRHLHEQSKFKRYILLNDSSNFCELNRSRSKLAQKRVFPFVSMPKSYSFPFSHRIACEEVFLYLELD